MFHSPKIFSTVSELMEILCENFIVKKKLLCFFLSCIFKKVIKKVLTILHSIECFIYKSVFFTYLYKHFNKKSLLIFFKSHKHIL